MRLSHILLGILTAAIWGFNFVFVKLGLQEMPPLLFCAIRFFLVSIPIVFFIPKPSVPFKKVISYGLITFALQFGLMMVALKTDIPAGLSALILQVQVFFSLFFALIFLKERLTQQQIFAAIICFSGLGIIWTHMTYGTSWIGFCLEIAYALSAAVSNVLIKKMDNVEPLNLIAWGGLVSVPALIMFSLVFEGASEIIPSMHRISWMGILALGYGAYISTWVGYGFWNQLIKKYSISSIIPFLLLVPLFGMLGSYLIFHESLPQWKLAAGLLIVFGLSIHCLSPIFTKSRSNSSPGAAKR